jgi:hypothetical protein
VPNIDWKKVFSQTDAVVSSPTAIDANSNVYQTGYSGLSSSANLLALRYDSTGILTYSYSYNNGGYDNGASIKADPLGNAYICGSSAGTATTGIDYIIDSLLVFHWIVCLWIVILYIFFCIISKDNIASLFIYYRDVIVIPR